jgi:hypothetical protein
MIKPLLAVQFKQILGAGMLSIAVLSIPSAGVAVTVQQVPNPRQVNGGWVTDLAGVLSPSTEAELNQIISQLEAKNGSEIAVVTVPDTAPSATPKQFATSLFNYWEMDKGQARRLSYEINPCPSFPASGWERLSGGSRDELRTPPPMKMCGP